LKEQGFIRAHVADKPAALKGHVFRRAAKTGTNRADTLQNELGGYFTGWSVCEGV
jgi:hypothetical protein